MSALTAFKMALDERVAHAHSNPTIPSRTIEVFTQLIRMPSEAVISAPSPNPLETAFDTAIDVATNTAEREVDLRLLRVLRLLAKDLDWFRRPSEPTSAFHQGHANAEIIGRRGIAEIENLTVGLTVMTPDTVYPDHHHPPEELYLVLSKGQWRQNDSPWHEPGYGGYVYNPPDIVHAMRSGDQPLLAIWCLHHADA